MFLFSGRELEWTTELHETIKSGGNPETGVAAMFALRPRLGSLLSDGRFGGMIEWFVKHADAADSDTIRGELQRYVSTINGEEIYALEGATEARPATSGR